MLLQFSDFTMRTSLDIKTFLLIPVLLSGLSGVAFSQEVVVENGLSNLYSTQNLDGSWGGTEDSINGVFPSTTTAVEALKLFEPVPSSNRSAAIQFLLNEELNVTDYLSRRIIALSGTGNDTSIDLNNQRGSGLAIRYWVW